MDHREFEAIRERVKHDSTPWDDIDQANKDRSALLAEVERLNSENADMLARMSRVRIELVNAENRRASCVEIGKLRKIVGPR